MAGPSAPATPGGHPVESTLPPASPPSGDGISPGPGPSPASGGGSEADGSATPPRVGVTSFVQHGQWVAAVTHIENPAVARAVDAEVLFSAIDPSGFSVATFESALALPPGSRTTVVAPPFILPSSATVVSSVEITLNLTGEDPVNRFIAPVVSFSNVEIMTGPQGRVSVGGQALSDGNGPPTLLVGCLARDPRGHLTGTVVFAIQAVPARAIDFQSRLEHGGEGSSTAVCRAMVPSR